MKTKSIYVIHRIEKIGPCEKDYNVFIRGSIIKKIASVHPVAYSSMQDAIRCARERVQFEKTNTYYNAVIADWQDQHQFYVIYRVGNELHHIDFDIIHVLLEDED